MTDKKKTETLTVRADEVRVGDWIEWLGRVVRSGGVHGRDGYWCFSSESVPSDCAYLNSDRPVTVTRTVMDPDADLIEAMAKADYEACGLLTGGGWLTVRGWRR